MSCPACAEITDQPDTIHCVRKCETCGRHMRVHEPGKHGIGLQIKKGDTVVLPAGFIKLSLDPRSPGGQFFKSGLPFFASLVFVEDLPSKRENFLDAIDGMLGATDNLLKHSALLGEFDLDDETSASEASNYLNTNHKHSVEWFAAWQGAFLAVTKQAIGDGDAGLAAWSMACAERFRAMIAFRQHLEDVVWMGHSAKRVLEALRTWDDQRKNDDEEFWQTTFTNNSFVLSQVFAAPIVFIQGKAFVGGTRIDGKGGKFVDFLASIESSSEAVLVEIKKPVTQLLGKEYRTGTFAPSIELSGAVIQARDYRAKLIENYKSLGEGLSRTVAPVDPKCVVIVGDAEAELTTPERRRSFELFRAGLKDVEVVTYDELFRKVEVLAQIFSLSRSTPPQEPGDTANRQGGT